MAAGCRATRSLLQSLRSDRAVLEHLAGTLQNEGAAISSFVRALDECAGAVFPTALGKSGAAASRMAASLRSIGMRSHWVHAAEWAHGDLGGLHENDAIVCFSNSGRTAELVALARHVQQLANAPTLLAITGDAHSELAQIASHTLLCQVDAGAELFDVMPAGSVVAQEALVNGLVSALAEQRGVSRADFLRHHPGGNIGTLSSSPA